MRKPGRLLVAAITIPCLTGCFGVLPAPLPATPAEREALDFRGVVLSGPDGDERVQFDEIVDVRWATDAVTVVGRPTDSAQLATRSFQLSELTAVLVRQVDAAKTSIIIGGVVVGGALLLATLVTGSFQPGS